MALNQEATGDQERAETYTNPAAEATGAAIPAQPPSQNAITLAPGSNPTQSSGFALPPADSGILTPPQRKYFELLNELIGPEGLDVSAKEFDTQFRYEAAYQIRLSTQKTVEHLANLLVKKLPSKVGKYSVVVADGARELFGLTQKKSGNISAFHIEGIPSASWYNKDPEFLKVLSPMYYSHLLQDMEDVLGCLHLDQTNFRSEAEKRFLTAHHNVVKATKATKESSTITPAIAKEYDEKGTTYQADFIKWPLKENLLQSYAKGAIPFNKLTRWYSIYAFSGISYASHSEARADLGNQKNGGGFILSPMADEYFRISIRNAVASIADRKKLSGKKIGQTNAHIAEMQSLWPQVVMTKEEYAAFTHEEAARQARKQAKETEAGQRKTAEGLAMEAEELKKPQLYEPHSTVLARIDKIASREIHPRTSEAEKTLIEGMQEARAAVYPLLASDALNAKIPAHQAFGDSVINDEVLGQLEYAFKSEGNGPPAYSSEAKGCTQEAIGALYQLTPESPGLVPEPLNHQPATLRTELQALRAATNERLKSALQASPALVIAVLGTAEQIKQMRDIRRQLVAPNGDVLTKNMLRRQLRDEAFTLLNSVGASLQIPAPDIAVITPQGQLVITESAYAPAEAQRLMTLTSSELMPAALEAKITEADRTLDTLLTEAKKLKDQPAIERYETLKLQLMAIALNEEGARDAFLQHIQKALQTRTPLVMNLSHAMVPSSPSPPPNDPPLPSQPSGAAMGWDEVRSRAERFVTDTLQQNPELTMFRNWLGMEPGHPLTLELSRWENHNGRRRWDRRSTTIPLNEPNIDAALEMKKRVQSHILNQQPFVEQRKLYQRPQMTEYDIIPNASPIVDPNRPDPELGRDGQPVRGRLDHRSGLFKVRLVFPEPDVPGRSPERTEISIPLGVAQSDDPARRAVAHERRLMVLDHLDGILADNTLRQQRGEPIVRVTGQDVRLWLEREIRRRGEVWEQANTIELEEYGVARDIFVNFPPAPAGTPPRTRIHIHGPMLDGKPNPFWKVELEIFFDDQPLGQKRVNFHINHPAWPEEENAENPPAPEVVLDRVRAVSAYVKDTLEAYAHAHPDASWQCESVNGKPKLEKLGEEYLWLTPNIDRTRVDRMIDALPYTGLLTVTPTVPIETLTPDEHGRIRFTLTCVREDGSPFRRQHGTPTPTPLTSREFVISVPHNADAMQIRRSVQGIVAQVQQRFTALLEEAYSPYRDHRYDPPGSTAQAMAGLRGLERIVTMMHAPGAPDPQGNGTAHPRKATERYDSEAIAGMFREAVGSVPDEQQPMIMQHRPRRPSGGAATHPPPSDNPALQPAHPWIQYENVERITTGNGKPGVRLTLVFHGAPEDGFIGSGFRQTFTVTHSALAELTRSINELAPYQEGDHLNNLRDGITGRIKLAIRYAERASEGVVR